MSRFDLPQNVTEFVDNHLTTINEELPERCPLCWSDDFNDEHPAVRISSNTRCGHHQISCNHVFGRPCLLEMWLHTDVSNRNTCPICRRELYYIPSYDRPADFWHDPILRPVEFTRTVQIRLMSISLAVSLVPAILVYGWRPIDVVVFWLFYSGVIQIVATIVLVMSESNDYVVDMIRLAPWLMWIFIFICMHTINYCSGMGLFIYSQVQRVSP